MIRSIMPEEKGTITIRPDGPCLGRLTTNKASGWLSPAWNPDGKRLAFVAWLARWLK
jgi:Tol biopolymer transport system component